MKTIQDYKADATLNKIVRYDEGTMTRKQWIELMKSKGHFVKEVQEPKIQYNRIKYNRMTGKEQEIYEQKCNEMKTGYRLYITETCSYDITKTEYDYFNSL